MVCGRDYLKADKFGHLRLESLGPIWVQKGNSREYEIVSVRRTVFSRGDGWNVLASRRVEEVRSWPSMAEHGRGILSVMLEPRVDHTRNRLKDCVKQCSEFLLDTVNGRRFGGLPFTRLSNAQGER